MTGPNAGFGVIRPVPIYVLIWDATIHGPCCPSNCPQIWQPGCGSGWPLRRPVDGPPGARAGWRGAGRPPAARPREAVPAAPSVRRPPPCFLLKIQLKTRSEGIIILQNFYNFTHNFTIGAVPFSTRVTPIVGSPTRACGLAGWRRLAGGLAGSETRSKRATC